MTRQKPEIEPQLGPEPSSLVHEDLIVGETAKKRAQGLLSRSTMWVLTERQGKSSIPRGVEESPSSFLSQASSAAGKKVFLE